MSHYSRHGSVLGSVHGYDEDEWGAAHDEQSAWGPPDRPGPRMGNPFSPSPAGSPSAYTFSSRQRTWSGDGDGGSRRGSGSYSGSFEERLPPPPQPPPPNGFAIPVRGSAAHARRPGSNADRDGDWHPPPGHRVRRSYESGSGGGGGSDAGGSYGSRRGSLLSSEAQRLGYGGTPTVEEERDQAWERERVREMERERERERERELERERDRETERERERERQERRERRARRERKERKEQQQKRERETEERARLRQRLRRETQAYPQRLLVYLRPVFRSQQVMEHAVEVFSKLDQDPRYLAQSAGVLLESLAAVGDKSGGDGTGLGDAGDSDDEEGGKGDGDAEGDDADEDDEDDDESEEDASKDSSDDGLGTKDESTGLSEDDDDDSVGDVKDHIVPGRRARYDERLDSIGSTARRLRSGGGSMSAHRKGSSSGGGPESGTSPASFMRWSGLRPYALNRDPAAVDDRCKSFLALTQIIGASTLVLPAGGTDEDDEGDGDEDDGDDPPEPPRSPRSSRKRSPPPPPKKKQQPQRVLSTNGLLAELRRVLRPRDYRAYFRASSARVIMLPLDTAGSSDGVGSGSNGSFGGGGSMGGGSMRRLSRQPMDETALEALERRLLSPTQFVPSPAAPPTAPLTTMACLTYSCAGSSSFGSITLYRVELAATGSATSARGVPRRLPRRIVPVAVMTGVPKELLRQTARAVPPECRTVLRAEADGTGGGYRCRSVALPDSTATVPAVLYAAADAGRPRLSAGFCAMLGIAPDGRSVRVARTASSSSPSSTSSSLASATADAKTAANDHAVGVQATVASLVAWLHVRAAYLTDVRLDVVAAPAPPASPTAKTATDKTSKAAKTTAAKATAKTATKTATTKAAQRADEAAASRPQTVQWSYGPAAIDHEGRDPCLVVLHPNAPWALAPLLLVERQP